MSLIASTGVPNERAWVTAEVVAAEGRFGRDDVERGGCLERKENKAYGEVDLFPKLI